MFDKLILLVLLPSCLSKLGNLTFNNVTFCGYSLTTGKIRTTVEHSNSLQDFLPKLPFHKIEFKDQNIPVLHEDSLVNLKTLDELVFENCGIHEIQPGALKNISMITNFSLNGNKIVEIKAEVFNHLQIVSLDLSGNLITTIHSNAFDDMRELVGVSLANNRIASWDINWFKNTPKLLSISMKNNAITKLPNYAFKNLVGSRMLLGIPMVIQIDLSYNKIKTIEPKTFRGLTETYSFSLKNNQLEEFDQDLLENVNVVYLYLNNNKIRCLQGDLKKILKAQTTNLDSNPFDCNCLHAIKEWVKKNHKDVELFYSETDCSVQKLKFKLADMQRRLEEIKVQDRDIEIAEGKPSSNPIK